MGEKSDSKKGSSPYVVLENRSLDQWRVTELKEELKKRKLVTKGLKEELVKRLDAAVRAEMDDAEKNLENDLNSEAPPEVQSDDAAEETADVMDQTEGGNEGLEKDNTVEGLDDKNDDNKDVEMGVDMVHANDGLQSLAEKMVTEGEGGVVATQVESFTVVREVSVETTVREAQPEVQSDDAAEETADVMDQTEGGNEGLEKDNTVEGLDDKNDDNKDVEMGVDMVHANDGLQSLAEKMVTEGEGGVVTTQVESFTVVREVSVETTVLVSENFGGQESQMIGNENMDEGLNRENGEPKPEQQSPEERPELGSSDLISGNQVDEVSQVQSDSISIDTITNIEKNEIKDNVIADDVKLEIDVKPEMILDRNNSESVEVDEQHKDEPTMEEKDANIVKSTNIRDEKDDVIADDVKVELDVKIEKVQPLTESVGVDEPVEENVTAEEKYVDNTENVDICKKNDSGDVGSPEKLNLDGDDSMEEDILESKQIDSKFSSDEVGDRSEKIEVKEDDSVHGMAEDANADKSFAPGEDKTEPSVASTKRKPYDQEGSENSEVVKRQRRWNSESLKVPEQLLPNHSASTTPKDAFQTLAKRTFSRSESTISQDLPKERVVPPTSNPPTTSLRIDHFLRPFTLKAVQELLGKTGTVVSFWMDQIKTHCYVTYASVEEAIETRNAVCNLQWPAYGGRLLMADFVDPQEVKNRVDPPPPSPAPPVTTIPPATTMQPPQPSPRQKQQLPPPPTLPPPPPLSKAPPARASAPPPEKIDPPIVTLDDLFKKTRATPRIYYLPLSDEQVGAKLNAQGKPVKH